MKIYNEKTFDLVLADGSKLSLDCYTTHTRNGFCHTVFDSPDRKVKASYINRTWECFTYESALYKFVEKYYKGAEKEGLKAQLKEIADKGRIEANEWLGKMEKMCNLISDEGKKRVAKAIDDNGLYTEEGMETAVKLAVALGL